MKWLTIIILFLLLFYSGCNENDTPNIAPSDWPLSISNLTYDPKTVYIEKNVSSFSISGTVFFTNAANGVSKLRLTNSFGSDLTVNIPANSEKDGTLFGNFEFKMLSVPDTYTFQIWVIDGKGRASNKLSGSIQIVNDDRMIFWDRILLSDNTWRMNRLLWVNEKFIAVGDDGVILISADANNWVKQSSPTSNNLLGMVWTGTQFIAVGEHNTIVSSPDGETWTLEYSDNTDSELHGVSWSGHNFVAVGRNSATDETVIITSPDGITWTKNSFVLSGGDLTGVAWSGSRFMAVGNKAMDPCCRTPKCICGFNPIILTSSNGLDWTDTSPVATSLQNFHDVTWDGSNFIIAAGPYGVSTEDGVALRYDMSTCNYLIRINYTDNKYVGLGSNACSSNDMIFQSGNGIQWEGNGSGANFTIPPLTLRDVVWSGTKFVVVGEVGSVLISPP